MELTDTDTDRRRVSPAVAARCAWSWQRSELTEVRHARIRPVVVLMLELAVMGAGVVLLSNPDAPIAAAALMAVTGALAGLLLAWGWMRTVGGPPAGTISARAGADASGSV